MNRILCWMALWLVAGATWARAQDDAERKAQAEEWFRQGNFAAAHAAYSRLDTNNLPETEQRWVRFRRADTGWRMRDLATLPSAEEAAPELVTLGKADTPAEQRDRVWAESQESLGDFHLRRRDPADWALTRYLAALGWWAGQTNLTLARDRYLEIARRIELPRGWPGARPDTWRFRLPDDVLHNVLTIAQRPADVAPFRLLLAERLGARRDGTSVVRAQREFEAALAASAGLPGRDVVLWNYGQWRERSGRVDPRPDGRWRMAGDPAGALRLYRQLLEEFRPGTSAFWSAAEARIQDLESPDLSVATPDTFLPGSEIVLWISGRNVTTAQLTLRKLEMGRDLKLPTTGEQRGDWKSGLPATGSVVDELSVTLNPGAPHEWVRQRIVFPRPIPAGAYLVELTGGGRTQRDLLLVTDAAVVVQSGGGQLTAWVVDAMTGRPRSETPVKVAQRQTESWAWLPGTRTTDANGLATFEGFSQGGPLLVIAGEGGHQAWAEIWSGGAGDDRGLDWRIYAFTDRPAYRPGEVVEWKLTARQRQEGTYRTPAQAQLRFQITDPQGAIVTNGVARLNTFGSAWGQLDLAPTATLGLYSISFSLEGQPEEPIGHAELFRVEEYRLPEFEVTITPPEEAGPDGVSRPRRLRAGEPITVQIRGSYYFGGPVAGGTAEVTVRKGPFHWDIPIPLEFPWLRRPDYGGWWRGPRWSEPLVRQTVTLDAQGEARFTFDPGSESDDAEYQFAVAMTDASRREVRAERILKATVDGYAVRATPDNRLPRPGTAVRVEFRARDANDQPVAVTGEVKITRKYWWEVWLDSFGREVSGDELKRRQAESPVWPPRVDPGMREWTLKSRGFREDAVSSQPVTTGTNGVGELRFTPDREGYFRIAWESPDVWALAGSRLALTNRIRSEGVVWATRGGRDLGYRTDGLQLILDRDTVRVGEKAPVMVVTSQPSRWVWLSTDAGGLARQEVFQMPDTTRLVEFEITERMVPNFTLQAVSVFDHALLREEVSVSVPPVQNFLNVVVQPDRTEYRPGSDGRLEVTVTDFAGKPVEAEVALSLVDESVFYIQKPLAPDPREFFFGEWRWGVVETDSSFGFRPYRNFIRGPGGKEEADGEGAGDEEARAEGTEFFHMERPRSLTPLPVMATRAGALALDVSQAVPSLEAKEAAGFGAQADSSPVVVRRDFRATAFWQPDVMTDPDGKASVAVRYPESTTRWLARGVAGSAGNQFGVGTNTSVTSSPLVVRLQTPRFLITGDTAVISANLNNNTGAALEVQTALAAEGVVVVGLLRQGQPVNEEAERIEVPAGGQARVDWLVRADRAGEATFTVTAKSATASDGMERRLPVMEYGLEQLLARSGKATEAVTVHLDLPAERTGPTEFLVRVTPSLAVTLLDALPFLADYPYGCTEQTLSRFLPAVIVRQTLREVGLDAETVMARAFGGISTNAAGQVAPGLGGRKDLLKLDDMVSTGLQRLYGFQLDSGAWGWWGGGAEDPWMTAYVVWGLRRAQAAGVVVEEERLRRADAWLAQQLVRLENTPDQAAWALHALASGRTTPGQPAPNDFERRAFESALARRAELNAYSQALLALAAGRLGFTDAARTLTDALAASAIREDAPDTSVLYGRAVTGGSTQPTAHWGRTDRSWRWSDNGVEATAFVVQALLASAPDNPVVEPAVTWLLKNRRGASWSNTRATAITLLALTDFLRVSGELKAELSLEVTVNGRVVARDDFQSGDVLRGAKPIVVPEETLRAGTNTVEIRRTAGTAPMYFSVEARFFNQEKPLPPAAADLWVRRDYFRLVPVPTLLEGVIDQRVPLREGEPLTSGDRLEARLVIETKNDLEYLLIEDLKPAGIEALEVRSGYRLEARKLTAAALTRLATESERPLTAADRSGPAEDLYVEWRDNRAALFASRLVAGGWEIRIPYRAETPGTFTALPTLGEAMYAPEIRGNSPSESMRISTE